MGYKDRLRATVKGLLESRGYNVQVARLPGVIPGARLSITKDEATHTVAVRTSADREVGLTRNQSGRWNMLGQVDEVLVAVPANDEDRSKVEVLSFRPSDLQEAFDAALKSNSQPGRKSWKSPIFVPLDDVHRGRPKKLIHGIKPQANWTEIVPLAAGEGSTNLIQESIDEFIMRTKRELAVLLRIDARQLTVTFAVKDRDSTRQ